MKVINWKDKTWVDQTFSMRSRSPSLLGFRLLTIADTCGLSQTAVPSKGSAFQIGHGLGDLFRSATTIHHVGVDLSCKKDQTVVAKAVIRRSRNGYFYLSVKEVR